MEPDLLNQTRGYDLNEVLTKSILFYEAQRAGPLERNNRIPYRGHSTLKDGCGVKANLEGGWFDAGDHVKFALPAAYSVTMLAWGILEYHQVEFQLKKDSYLRIPVFMVIFFFPCYLK